MSGVTLKPWGHENIPGKVFVGANKVVGELGPIKSIVKLLESGLKLFGSINLILIAKHGLDLLKNCEWIRPVSECITMTKVGLTFFEVIGSLKDATTVNSDGQTMWTTGTKLQKVKTCAQLGASLAEMGDILGGFKVFDLAAISSTVGINPFSFAKNTLALVAGSISLYEKSSKIHTTREKCHRQDTRMERFTNGNLAALGKHYQEKIKAKKYNETIGVDGECQTETLEEKYTRHKELYVANGTVNLTELSNHAAKKLQLHKDKVAELKRFWSILYTSDDLLKQQTKCDKWEKKQKLFTKLNAQPDNAEIDKLKDYYEKKESSMKKKLERWEKLAGLSASPTPNMETFDGIASSLAPAPVLSSETLGLETPAPAATKVIPEISTDCQNLLLDKMVRSQAKRKQAAQEIKKNIVTVIMEIAKIALLSTVIGLTIAGLVVGGPVGWLLLVPALGFVLSCVGITKTCVENLWKNKTVPQHGQIQDHKRLKHLQALAPAA
jgi:hypothetical protein